MNVGAQLMEVNYFEGEAVSACLMQGVFCHRADVFLIPTGNYQPFQTVALYKAMEVAGAKAVNDSD